ncbi:hypothetical protein C3492_04665 [Streptomyces sp. Ru62]|uniref:hypothetical protein n=1 Tax=Streptomyces sp. Ru62 TaxID=2080745 RepID=UPI000CDDB5CC|nr:hypothetical protein [Streptomyces sp. Ru62]POX64618.1 hypothetical protein C3492_04665 [Streptomyces sp. Ru62]
MTRPHRGRLGYVAALAVGASLFAAACAGAGQERQSAGSGPEGRPAGSGVPAVGLTSRQARHALLTEAYLGSQWTEVKDSGDRREGLLRGTVNAQDWLTHKEDATVCRRLLDRLSDDRILDAPLAGTQAVAVFDADDGNRMRYEVGTYPAAELRAAREWFGALPQKCGVFIATRPDGSTEDVRVTSLPVPEGDGTRQALSVVAKGTTEGVPFTMSLDVALMASGDSAVTVVNGGLADASHLTTKLAVRLGAPRLTTVLAGGTPPAQPTGLLD